MISKYKTNTQPLYVLTDSEGNSLNTAKPNISYVGVTEYENWLKQVSNYKKIENYLIVTRQSKILSKSFSTGNCYFYNYFII
jgi:hypothetical protein